MPHALHLRADPGVAPGSTRRRLWFLLAFSALAALAAAALPFAESVLQRRLESVLSSRLGLPVRIASVDIHPLSLAAVFRSVQAGPAGAPLFSCESWTLRVRPLPGTSGYPGVLSWGRSTLEKPRLDLRAFPENRSRPLSFRGLAGAPLHRVSWRDGVVRLPALRTAPALDLESVGGSLDLSIDGLRLEARGGGSAGPFTLAARLAVRPAASGALPWDAELSLQETPLKEVVSRLPRFPGKLEGAADLRARAEGGFSPGAAAPLLLSAWSVEGSSTDGAWTPPEGARTVPFTGSFSLKPREIGVKDLRISRGITVNGICRRPFEATPSLSLTIRGKQVALAEWARTWPGGPRWSRSLDGSADFEARLTGPLRRPDVDLHAEVRNGRAGPVSLPPLDLTLSRKREVLAGKAVWLGGNIALSGRRSAGNGNPASFSLRAEGLELAGLARANAWGEIGGTLSGDMVWTPGPARTQAAARGSLRVERLVWGASVSTAPIIGDFSFAEGRLTVQGGDSLRVIADQSPGKWTLSELSIRQPGGLSLDAAGSIQGPERRMDFRGALRGMPLRNVPALLARYPAADGRLSFEGELKGTAASPAFEGELAMEGVRLAEGGPLHQGRASVRWSDGSLEVSRFDLDGAWSGRAAWSPAGRWSIGLEARQADVGLLAEILRSTVPVAGAADGNVTLSSSRGMNPAGWTGEGKFALARGRLGPVEFEKLSAAAALEKSALRVERLNVYQSSGSMRAAGTFFLGASRGAWILLSQFKHFTAPSLVLDGDLRGRGRAGGGVSGEFRSPSLWVNGYGLGAVEGEASFDGRRLSLSRLRLGSGVSGELSLDLAERTLSSRGFLKDAALAQWGPRLRAAHPALRTGAVSGSWEADGPWSSPRCRFVFRWERSLWNGVPVDAVAEGTLEDGRLTFRTLRALLPDGGKVEGAGGAVLPVPSEGNPGATDVSLRIKDVPLGKAAKALGIRAPDLGVFNGTVLWSGPWRSPRLEADLSGGGFSVGEQRVTGWTGRLVYHDRRASLEKVVLNTPEGLWRVRDGGQVFLTGPGEGHFQIVNDLRNIQLGPLNVFGGLELVGQWKTQPRTVFDFNLRAQSLWVNQHFFDQDLARVVWSGPRVQFEPVPGGLQNFSGVVRLDRWPQVRLENLALWENNRRRFWIRGEVGPEKWDFSLEGRDLEAGTLMSLADLDWPMDGLLDVHATGRGSPRDPDVEGSFTGRQGTLGVLPYDKMQASILWKGSAVQVKNLQVVRRQGYVIRGEGRFPASAGAPSDNYSLHLALANGNLAVLKDIWPECRSARGIFHGEFQVRPGREGPRASGFLILEDGQVRAQKYFRQLTDLNAVLTLKNDRLLVETLSGRLGGGQLVVKGDLGVSGLGVTDYNLSIESVGRRGVAVEVPQLSVPPGPLLRRLSFLRESLEGVSQGEPRVSLRITGPHGQHRVQGTLVLENTQFTYPPSKESLRRLRRGAWLPDFWQEAFWDVTFKTGENTWYRNEFVNVHLKGSLRIEGRRGDMRVDGRMETRRGIITYLGQTFIVKRALFEAVTDPRPELAERLVTPYLSGEAERTTTVIDPRGFSTQDTITMVVERKPLGEIQPKFKSRANPDISPERAAQRALGLSAGEQQQLSLEERDQLRRAGLVQLVGSAAGPLANRLAHRFGIDMLYPIYEPNQDEDRFPATAAVPTQDRTDVSRSLLEGTGAYAGFRLTDRISGAYKFKVEQTQDEQAQNQFYFHDEVELTYRLYGSLHLRASTELDNRKLLGQRPDRRAVLENQWRFGFPPKKGKNLPQAAATSSTVSPKNP